MTQTITKSNTIPTGTMYPVEHLRTAESIEQLCEYVDAGHPIATRYGNQVRLFRKNADGYSFDIWYEEPNDDGNALIDWVSECAKEPSLLPYIKIAPLAYKDGRPLHVGDKASVGSSAAEITIDVDWIRLIVAYGSALEYKGILPLVGYRVILR